MYINILKLKTILLSVSLILCMNFNVYAADISAIDFNGELLGKVIPDGGVINFNNELVGHITADGYVVDDNNALIGVGFGAIKIFLNNGYKILCMLEAATTCPDLKLCIIDLISDPTTCEATETTPCAPIDNIGNVKLSSPE